MPIDLSHLVDAYGRFEQQVRQWTENRCGHFCAHCQAVCCRNHYCDETRQSVFLTAVARHFSSQSVYHPSNGWLTPTGCSLVAGRPPVCYEFLCRRISSAFGTDPILRHALLAVSMAMTHVGRRAIGGRHLVTAMDQGDLKRIRPDRLMTRLDEARAAFRVAADLFAHRPPARPVETLLCIVPAPLTGFRSG